MKKRINIYDFKMLMIISLTIILGEVHHFFDKSEIYGDWILFKSIGTTHITWYVSQNADMLIKIIYLSLIYKFVQTRKSEVLSFFTLLLVVCSIIDIPLYWLNYRTSYYGLVYLIGFPITYYIR